MNLFYHNQLAFLLVLVDCCAASAPLTEVQSASAISAIVIGSLAAVALMIGCLACACMVYKAETTYNQGDGYVNGKHTNAQTKANSKRAAIESLSVRS